MEVREIKTINDIIDAKKKGLNLIDINGTQFNIDNIIPARAWIAISGKGRGIGCVFNPAFIEQYKIVIPDKKKKKEIMGLEKRIITRDDIVKHKLSEYIDSKLEKPEAYIIHIKSKSEGIYGAQYFMTTSLHDGKLYVIHYYNRVKEDDTYSIIINEYDCISELNSFDITQDDINNTYYSLYPDKNRKA